MTTIVGIIKEVVGDQIELGGPITRDMTITSDLELESIDIVVISEKIQSTYGDKIDFTAWLSGMDLDEITRLTIGDLVDFIDNATTQDSNS